MISLFKHPIFVFASLVFWINLYLEKSLGIFIPVYHAYGDDLIAMPVVFAICLQVMRWIHPIKSELIFRKKQLAIGLIYFSIVFELILPRLSPEYIADPIDVFCYLLGTLMFYRFMNKSPLQSKKPLLL